MHMRNGLSIVNPPLKKKQLGTGGGQLSLRQDQGGCGGLRAFCRFGQLGPEGGSPARSLIFNQPQPLVELARQACADFLNAAVDLFLDSGLPRANIILRQGNLALPCLQPLQLKAGLGGLERQRLLAPLELRPVDGGLLHRPKGHVA